MKTSTVFSLKAIVFLVLSIGSTTCRGEQSEKAETKPYALWDGKETVEQYAKRINLAPKQTLDLGNNVKLELMLIPAGKFTMGMDEPKEPDAATPKSDNSWQEYQTAKTRFEKIRIDHPELPKDFIPAHQVTITRPFYIGKLPVTQAQYQQIMGVNPSKHKGKDNPVDTSTWNDAQDFCKKLTERTKQQVRLPTEAEWEYCCRAGLSTLEHSGDTEKELDRIAWYLANGKNTNHPVGQKDANAFGIYDMLGNTFQWCEDWFVDDFYSKSPAEDPIESVQLQRPCRVFRGASSSFRFAPAISLTVWRGWRPPTADDPDLGFRIATQAVKAP